MNIAPGEPRFTAVMKVPGGFWLVSCNDCRAVIGIGQDDQRLHLEWHERQQPNTCQCACSNCSGCLGA